MNKTTKKTTDAVTLLYRRYIEGRPEMEALMKEAREEDEAARKIFALRTKAGLTQRELAKIVGTTPSVISRLENADYEGHSLSMLRRIAKALNTRVKIEFVPIRC